MKRSFRPIRLLLLVFAVPAWFLACLVFPTEIEGAELRERVIENHPGVFDATFESRDPAWELIEANVNRKNLDDLATSEAEIHAEEVLLYRRMPAALVLFVVFIALFDLARRRRSRAGPVGQGDWL